MNHAHAEVFVLLLDACCSYALVSFGLGKSLLLKAISGRLSHDSNLKGELLFNGRTQKENKQHGIYVNRLCGYVGQTANAFPVLTVKETFQFATDNALPDAKLLKGIQNDGKSEDQKNTRNHSQHKPERDEEQGGEDVDEGVVDEVIKLDKDRPDLMIDMLGLRECADVIIGNDLLRGISGGQSCCAHKVHIILWYVGS